MIMKRKLLLLVSAACFVCAGYVVKAQAAGPATNQVTLFWQALISPMTPYVFEVQQSNLNTNSWITIANNLPSTTLTLTLLVDKDPARFWRVRALNATNSAWATDFSNLVNPAWPGLIGTLGIRPGP